MKSGKCSFISVVAMMVMVLLAGILLAAWLAGERQKARRSTCLCNLKCITQALKMYADGYDGMMPSSYLVDHSRRWNARDCLTFTTRLGRGWSDKEMRDRNWSRIPKQTWSQILYESMRCHDTMFCPSDQAHKTDPNTAVSYWYKLANDKAWYGIGCGEPRRKMSDFGYESDQIAFYEHQPFHFGGSGGLRNGAQINVSFLDSHVKTITLRNATSGNPINCAANSNGEPMYYNTRVDPKTGKDAIDKGAAIQIDPAYCYDKL